MVTNMAETFPACSKVAANFIASAKTHIDAHLNGGGTYLTLCNLKGVLTEVAPEDIDF